MVRFASNPEPAPRLVIHDLAGKVTTMDDLKGKVVLVNFWATWCPPCRAEIPALIKLQEQHRDRLQIIGISEDDEIEDVHEFVKKAGINYPVVMATPELIAAYGGVVALPTTFVVDTEGRIVQRHLGLLNAEYTEREILALHGLPMDARVEYFEDTGQIFGKNVEKATELPDVDFSGLTAGAEESGAAAAEFRGMRLRVQVDAGPLPSGRYHLPCEQGHGRNGGQGSARGHHLQARAGCGSRQ